MGRRPCCDKTAVKRGAWSPEEDAALKRYVQTHGSGGNWITLPHKAGLRRCGKSCRLRWLNYLRPNIKHGGFTEEEDSIICTLYNQIGSRWSVIASQLPGRTDNDIKNYWNTKLKKRMIPAGKIANNNDYPPSGIDSLSDLTSYYVPRFEFSNHFEQCCNYFLPKKPRIDIYSGVDVTSIGFHDANANAGEEGLSSVSGSNSVLLEYKQPLISENAAEANFQGYDQMMWMDLGSGSGSGFSGHEEYLLGEAAGSERGFQSREFAYADTMKAL